MMRALTFAVRGCNLCRNPDSSFRKLVEETTEGAGSVRGGTADVLARALEDAQN